MGAGGTTLSRSQSHLHKIRAVICNPPEQTGRLADLWMPTCHWIHGPACGPLNVFGTQLTRCTLFLCLFDPKAFFYPPPRKPPVMADVKYALGLPDSC